ncbi:2-oxoglutarate ferredoxin oxidoreductase subunit gamma [bacterium BMS3Abin05]|nr:2-oxoglutarate ferredoxin oxidoreductase subunit gamma [bacterium BMS3Abin05]GBE27103.1 2-oxoglutarate ferredoxin oxidoreductase subunit gamma [bacterium BMS3Bbin03]HDZ11441.1 2-oxoacid:ferredoxin oxidoreductase subunit gamma [Bacteroidota bacterium]
MSNRVELRFSGVGGQGAILAGAILAEAAVYFDGKYALQSPTYTAQVRGGATKVDVIISSDPIIFPQTSEINFYLAFAQRAYDRFYGGNNPGNRFFRDMTEDAIVLVDSDLVTNFNDPPHRVIKLPILQLALKELGRTVFSNVLALGIVTGITKVVSDEAIVNAVKRRAPRGTEEMNLKALNIGFNFAKKYMEQKSIDPVTV